MRESEFFLRFRPLISERQKVIEGFLSDHVAEGPKLGDELMKEQKVGNVKGREGNFE